MKSKTRMRVNENGRVVIPASFRERLGIRVGDDLVLRMEEAGITTRPFSLTRMRVFNFMSFLIL